MADTVRNRIMAALKERFLSVQEGVDDHVLTWNTVVRNILTDEQQRMGSAISLVDLSEQKVEEVGFVRSTLRVATEFWITTKLGDEPFHVVNEVLGDVQRTMRLDVQTTVDGVAHTLNIVEESNETDIEGAADKLVGGVIIWTIQYRHLPLDPTKLVGE